MFSNCCAPTNPPASPHPVSCFDGSAPSQPGRDVIGNREHLVAFKSLFVRAPTIVNVRQDVADMLKLFLKLFLRQKNKSVFFTRPHRGSEVIPQGRRPGVRQSGEQPGEYRCTSLASKAFHQTCAQLLLILTPEHNKEGKYNTHVSITPWSFAHIGRRLDHGVTAGTLLQDNKNESASLLKPSFVILQFIRVFGCVSLNLVVMLRYR